jgi:hypothetical protein
MIYFENGFFHTNKYPTVTFSLNRQLGSKDLGATLDILYREFPSASIDFLPSHCNEDDESFISFPTQRIHFPDHDRSFIARIDNWDCNYKFQQLCNIDLQHEYDQTYTVKYKFSPNSEISCLLEVVNDDLIVEARCIESRIYLLEVEYTFVSPHNELSFQNASAVIMKDSNDIKGVINSNYPIFN